MKRSGWQKLTDSIWLGPALLVLYCLFNLLVISPSGNFPLNDDWLYSESVFHFMKTGQFHLLGCSPVCLMQVALGVAACSLFGQSHEVLRCLTIALGLATEIILYFTLLRLGLKRFDAFLLVMVLAANPIFVNVTFSFMTDVPALFFVSLYCFFTITALQKQSSARAFTAGVMLCLAILVRQNYAALAVCNLLLLLLGRGNPRRMQFAFLTAGLAAPLIVAMLGEKAMTRGNEFVDVYDWYKHRFISEGVQLVTSPLPAWGAMFERIFKLFCYYGLFFLPLIPAAVTRLDGILSWRPKVARAALAVALLIVIASYVDVVIFKHQMMPFNLIIMQFPQLGPLDIMGFWYEFLPNNQKIVLTVVCALLAIPLLSGIVISLIYSASQMAVLVRNAFVREVIPRAARARLSVRSFACALLAASLGFVAIQVAVLDFDRYYLMAMPALLVCFGLLVRRAGFRKNAGWAVCLMLGLAAYSTLADADYLSWNRARWQALRELEKAGVSPLKVDGGVEYNYLANPGLIDRFAMGGTLVPTKRGAYPRSVWRWWTINDEDYIISFSALPDYDVIARHSYFSDLTMSCHEILTLKRRQ